MRLEFSKDLDKNDILDWKSIYKKDLEGHYSSTKLTYQKRKKLVDSDFAVIITTKKKTEKEPRKIRMFPIQDEVYVEATSNCLEKAEVKKTLTNLGVNIANTNKRVLAKAKELGMTEVVKRYSTMPVSIEELVEKIKMDLRTSEVKNAELKDEKKKLEEEVNKIKEEKKNLEEEKKKITKEKLDAEKAKELEEKEKLKKEQEAELYKKNGKKIAERKSELGDFVKDLSDEDLLDETKYEIAKLKKENYELREKSENLDTGHKESEEEIKKLREKVAKEKRY